jgi:hypothetical protein
VVCIRDTLVLLVVFGRNGEYSGHFSGTGIGEAVINYGCGESVAEINKLSGLWESGGIQDTGMLATFSGDYDRFTGEEWLSLERLNGEIA